MPKGYMILSEGRSGTTWLGSLANATGLLGNSQEWLRQEFHARPFRSMSPDAFFQKVMENGSTPNGAFAVKIFPGHLLAINRHFGFDFIQRCLKERDMRIILLTREDTMAQAVSFARGRQTDQWTSGAAAKADPIYDFDQICRFYFKIRESYEFWNSYVAIHGLSASRFIYERLVPDVTPFLRSIADFMGVELGRTPVSPLTVQRDDLNDQWIERFKHEIGNRNILGVVGEAPVSRTSRNLMRFITKKPLILRY